MWWLLWWVLAGCGGGVEDTALEEPGQCDAIGPTQVALIHQLTFARASEDGVSHGFDLDGQDSRAGDSAGCFIADYVSPDGDPGIDNAFARLMPALELTEAQAVEPLIQETINSGQLLLFFELEDLDDPRSDPCVNLTLLRGKGAPVVGNDRIVSGQTFERDAETFSSRVEGVRLEDGTLVAGPLTLELPVTVFAVDLLFVLQDAMVRLDLREDGAYWGYLAGGLALEDILAVAREENVDPDLAGILEGLLALNADLAPNDAGECTQISVTLEFAGVSAFFFED